MLKLSTLRKRVFRIPNLQVGSKRGRVLVGGLIGLTAGLLLTAIRDSTAIENIELRILDVQTVAFPPDRPPDPRIVLSQIYESDIEVVRQNFQVGWPWELDLNAAAFALMAEAKVVQE